MIDTSIAEIFGSLSIGLLSSFIILTAIYYLHVVRKGKLFFKWLISLLDLKFSAIAITIFSLAVYSFGLIMQDYTDYFSDSDSKNGGLPFFRLESESKWRALALLKENREEKYVLNGLGRSVLNKKTFLQYELQRIGYAGTSELIENPTKYFERFDVNEAKVAEIEKFINPIYYRAKNWVVSIPQYSEELVAIQRRIDFARSLYFVLSILMYLLLLFMVLVYFLVRGNAEFMLAAYGNIFLIGVVAIGTMGIARKAYGIAELNYNERAFGYYVSHLDEEDRRDYIDVSAKSVAIYWMQRTLEYKVACTGIYNSALDYIKIKKGKNALREAVVLDLDETVLDNSVYQAALAKKGRKYDEVSWANYVAASTEDSKLVGLVPGALGFIREVRKINIVPVYISNRQNMSKIETIEILTKLRIVDRNDVEGKDYELYLAEKGDNSKVKRRRITSAKYKVLALIGDNIKDIDDYFDTDDEIGISLTAGTLSKFGRGWFLLPNPSYGGWEKSIISGCENSYLQTGGFEVK